MDDTNARIEIGIVGGGSMGSGMTLLFAEKGSSVGAYDKDAKAVEKTIKEGKDTNDVDNSKVHGYTTLQGLVDRFDPNKPRVIVFSLPHGDVVESVISELCPLLKKGDIILDGGNEFWENTERRQKKVKEEWGLHWIGMGVSGGYQAARRGPSISPGGDEEAWKIAKPLLEKWAARDKDGNPCVGLIGPGGSGHYVKMIHNGIEQAHLSLLAELRSVMHTTLSLTNAAVADIFEAWDSKGGLSGNYLISIGYKALRFKKGDGFDGEKQMKDGIVEGIEDKVTQDVDNSEGTGVWSCMEIASRHCAAPSIAAAHQLRIISANKGERIEVCKNLEIPQPSTSKKENGKDKDLIETLRLATYGSILAAFVQGMGIIARASKDQGWNVSLAECIRIWRAGCIIQSDGISEFLYPLLTKNEGCHNLLQIPEIARELAKTYSALKKVVAMGVETDACMPAFGATLEWFKSVGGRDLPTSFEEMQLDYFGHHNYDLKSDPQPGTHKGSHHTEFAPA